MKLDKFIKDNCCNLVRNECVGVWNVGRFNNTTICHPINKEEPLPCQYFEKVVLPWAMKLNCHEELVDEYSRVDFGVVARTKKIRDKEAKKTKKSLKKLRKYVK